MIHIEKLSTKHDRLGFDCGVEELNPYLIKYSGQHERKGIGRTYVAIADNDARAWLLQDLQQRSRS